MTKFTQDIQTIYDFISDQKDDINKLYEYLEQDQDEKLVIIQKFAKDLGVELSNDMKLALITRLVSLRDDSLVQVLKQLDFTEAQIITLQEKAYQFAKNYWLDIHKKRIDFIASNNLLTPFYREIFNGVYAVGVHMSKWQTSWTKMIINGVNKDLLKKFDNDDEKVMNYLEENNLFDKGHDGLIADRSYSMLTKDDKGAYKSSAYITAFKKEVTDIVDALETFVDRLIELEDDVYNQKWQYIEYLQSINAALSEDKTDKLVAKWAQVDRTWMKISTPIQIGHPLEYYEDHFRKAVALEWDIRLVNPKIQNNNERVSKIKTMFAKIFENINKKESQKIYDFSLKSLDKVQLYLGRPALFFAAEFNGLFSAQVVPNDEIVSKEYGKKIFAFSDEILQGQKAKPFLKLSKEIFGQEFLSGERKFLFDTKNTQKWHQVYDITTIGHEFGHILWCDDETETVMNKTANFKNIEEFKATTGGLVSFFTDTNTDEKDLEKFVISDTIKRAVGLIAWMEVDEVQPYYCEGMIHLFGLFETKVLAWDIEAKKLTIDTSDEKIENLKKWYIQTYSKLAIHYLDKKDATLFLQDYAIKKDNKFTSVDATIDDFIQYYFKRYQKIGQELDTSDEKDNYL